MENLSKPLVFNGPVEFGMRTALLLEAAFPGAISIQRLVILDYLMVHSGDVPDGPDSLHAPSPLRAGEIAIRQNLIEQGLQLLASRGLADVVVNSEGIQYRAVDLTMFYVSSFRGDFIDRLHQRGIWALELTSTMNDNEANRFLIDSSRAWRSQFVDLAESE